MIFKFKQHVFVKLKGVERGRPRASKSHKPTML